MKVYRLTKTEYASDISGAGAAQHGGRWNRPGTAMLYTGASVEIALLETIANAPPMLVPALSLVTVEFPETSVYEIHRKHLPKNWRTYPPPAILAEIGDNWAREMKTLALKVPSCIVPSAFNYILNCQHPLYSQSIKIVAKEKFNLDPRLRG